MPDTTIRLLGEHDVEAALRLCRLAGWNQRQEDWLRLIRYQPQGCFAAERDRRLVGTVTTTSYQDELAWIGMMLIDPADRRQGIATKLIRVALDYLHRQKIRCVKLDATPEGQLVYQRLGFQVEWGFYRWERERFACQDPGAGSSCTIERCLVWDAQAFGANRSALLGRLSHDSRCVIHPHGFGMCRPGKLATYLGPVAATEPETARQVVTELISGVPGRIFWDVPQANPRAVELAKRAGFATSRNLTRMWWGDLCHAKYDWQYALADPGTG
ncbi:MAG: GNAT family N-acetyltransferase [Pirellulales bacterium]|nr:GNAT family N-acetyltransferase [Pirellulales bacterium]